MFITGPNVIKQVTGEDVTAEQLGGADTHMSRSGVIHFIAEDDKHALLLCKKLLSFLPSNNAEDPPEMPSDGNVDATRGSTNWCGGSSAGVDVREVIVNVIGTPAISEVQAEYARIS